MLGKLIDLSVRLKLQVHKEAKSDLNILSDLNNSAKGPDNPLSVA